MELECSGFFSDWWPDYPQQGDIYSSVPLLELPAWPQVIILRDADGHEYAPELPHGPLEGIPEEAVDAFSSGPEYVIATMKRSVAMIVTQTCDLEDSPTWLACPLFTLADSEVDRGNLFSRRYANLFGVCEHPEGKFGESYINLGNPFPVRRGMVAVANRIASLSAPALESLIDQIAANLSRPWGFGPGEAVPHPGHYRCLRCFQSLGSEVTEIEVGAGDSFPECRSCQKFRKKAQWRLLQQRKR